MTVPTGTQGTATGGVSILSITSKKGRLSAIALFITLALTGCNTGTTTAPTTPKSPADGQTQAQSNINNPVDPGSSLHGRPAPNFTLTDQFGKPVSLAQFRGKVVVLAFVDSQCTTICPLTTQSMMDALKQLGPAAAKDVQLVGINANPTAITVSDVKNYSQVHGMMQSWHFLTGSLAQLEAVWHNYYIYAGIVNGQIDHTPALYIIDPKGHEQFLYLTPNQYGAVTAQASVLAHDIARYLPSAIHPSLTNVNYQPPGFNTNTVTKLPVENPSQATSGGTSGSTGANGPAPVHQAHIPVGPGKPQLLAFFASWVPTIKQDLLDLNTYAKTPNHPDIIGIDVGSTEPNLASMLPILHQVGTLQYPMALDKSGNVADTYKVQDLPWLALTNGKGSIIWSHDGLLPPAILMKDVQQALQHAK